DVHPDERRRLTESDLPAARRLVLGAGAWAGLHHRPGAARPRGHPPAQHRLPLLSGPLTEPSPRARPRLTEASPERGPPERGDRREEVVAFSRVRLLAERGANYASSIP